MAWVDAQIQIRPLRRQFPHHHRGCLHGHGQLDEHGRYVHDHRDDEDRHRPEVARLHHRRRDRDGHVAEEQDGQEHRPREVKVTAKTTSASPAQFTG
jgi:hypothetical protein